MGEVVKTNRLFVDECRYSGRQGLPGSETLPNHWSIASGDFTTRYESHLRVLEPGELVYSGDELSTSDVAIECKFFAVEDTIIEIRGRRSSDGSSYISLNMDLENDTITLSEVSDTTTTVLDITNKVFDWNGYFAYTLMLVMNGSKIFGYVQRGLFLEGTSSLNSTETGFSIYVPQIWEEEPFKIKKIIVSNTHKWPDPKLEDKDWDLMLQHRKRLKELCESPPERTQSYFLQAREAWNKHRNDGRPDVEWANLGYPIREPVAEEWFIDTDVYYVIINVLMDGSPVENVTLSGFSEDTQTNKSGQSIFPISSGESVTITPQKDGYTFTPSSYSIGSINSDTTIDFSAEEMG